MDRKQLVNVFEDTLKFIKEDALLSDANKESIRNTEFITGKDISSRFKKQKFLNNVFVTSSKTFEAARRLHLEYPNLKIAVLNFASATNPGGGVTKGSSAQEESLCRCSTLYNSLTTDEMFRAYYAPNRDSTTHNALHTDDIIYSPGIVICKDDSSYERLNEEDFVTVDVISCAAPNLRERPANNFNPNESEHVNITSDELYRLHVNRARNIFEAALAHNVSVLVLGAFGCGAFRNDPTIVSRAYHDVLEEYASKFVEIEFAIFSKSDADSYNYSAFKRKFGDE